MWSNYASIQHVYRGNVTECPSKWSSNGKKEDIAC
jgi:hypothetical protein